jgi:hypothetical protein
MPPAGLIKINIHIYGILKDWQDPLADIAPMMRDPNWYRLMGPEMAETNCRPGRPHEASPAAGPGLVADRLERPLGRLEVIALELDPPVLHRTARSAGVLEPRA